MAAPRQQQNVGFRALAHHGFADLSPPEAEHALLELPTNRADYVSVLQDMGDYPRRSPIGQRVPSDADIAALKRGGGRWRGVVLLDDERALTNAACVFNRVFVLDPFYDSGAQLYAAWHDPVIKDEHARRLAEQAGLLVRVAPLLNGGTAVLAPDHLPGSWNPRPGWRKPRASEDRRQLAAWAMRRSLVLLFWADRLDGVVCTTRTDVVAGLDVALGPKASSRIFEVPVPRHVNDAQAARLTSLAWLSELWADLRAVSRKRDRYCLEDAAFVLSALSEGQSQGPSERWRLVLGERSVPDPAMLIRRVLNGQDPERDPPLPRKRLKRRPLCLLAA
jgi:hypothetical protein